VRGLLQSIQSIEQGVDFFPQKPFVHLGGRNRLVKQRSILFQNLQDGPSILEGPLSFEWGGRC